MPRLSHAHAYAGTIMTVAVIVLSSLSSAAPASADVGIGDQCPVDDSRHTINSDAAVIYGTAESDIICGGPSRNKIIGGLLDDDIYGGGGNDTLIGGHGTDTLNGGSGDDWLRGGTGRDCYSGDGGNDTVSFESLTPDYDFATPGIVADLSAPDATIEGVPPSCTGFAGNGRAEGEGFNEELVDVENLIGSAFDDVLTGAGDGFNKLYGSWGDDAIHGKANSPSPTDDMRGEDGRDTCTNNGTGVTCADPRSNETHRPTGAFVASTARVGADSGAFIFGGEGNGADTFTVTRPGPNGEDVASPTPLTAIGGNCSQNGPNGARCGIGTPSFIVVWGDDGDDTLRLGDGFLRGGTIDINGGPGNDSITGGSSDDALHTGEGGRDQLFGREGTDSLISEGDPVGSGGDTLDGGGGNDQLVTDNACAGHTFIGGLPDAGDTEIGDILGFSRSGRLVVPGGIPAEQTIRYAVYARFNWDSAGGDRASGLAYAIPKPTGCVDSTVIGGIETLEGTDQGDTLYGNRGPNRFWGRAGNDKITANDGNDVLYGNAGNDTLVGEDGNDTLWGQLGTDTLYGNNGDDKLRALDNVRDSAVNCGAGRDFAAQADPEDPVQDCGEQ